jgi:hypothetical protein
MKKVILLIIIALTLSVFVNAQTRVEIKSADLPKAITQNIAKDFNGYAILKTFKFENKNVLTYEVVVLKGTDKERLKYSAAGVFIKKVPIAPNTTKKAPAKQEQPKEKGKVQTKPQVQSQPQSPQKIK